jgi:hypothetical protein
MRIACTLSSSGLAAQARHWEQLIAQSMTEYAETADGLRLSFRPEPGVAEELRRLVAVENECCSWAEWTVETNAEATVLDIHSSARGGLAALRAMFRPVSAP